MNSITDSFLKTLPESATVDDLFSRYLPAKLSREDRLYAGMVRKAYDDGQIDLVATIQLCELMKTKNFNTNRISQKKFLNILGFPSLVSFEKDPQSVTIVSVAEENDPSKIKTEETDEESVDAEDFFKVLNLDVPNIKKLNGSGLSSVEINFLIQISEWGLVGVF